MTSTSHTLSAATPFAPTEPGALAGFEVRCSCGWFGRTSLSARATESAAQAHLAWAVRTGR